MLFLHYSDNFRTEFRTEKKLVRMNTRFFLHNHVRKDGTSIVYLRITSDGKEIRHPLDLFVEKSLWNSKAQKLIGSSEEATRINLILENIKARLSDIKTDYHLKRQPLTAELLLQEFRYNITKVDFLAFFEVEMGNQAKNLEKATIKKHKKVLSKLRSFRKNILFSNIDEKFIIDYKTWCKKKGNREITISTDLAVLKKYLRIAIKNGIHTSIRGEEIKIRRTDGMRENLNLNEVRKLTDYYENEDLNEICQHALGLFLFSCWTGLRLSDLQKLKRSDLNNDYLLIEMHKGKKPIRIPLNGPAKKLIKSIDWDLKYSDQKMRDELHLVRTACGISKKVTFHIGRHTFATNYYRKTKDLLMLQRLLGHSNVKETMIYTHIVDMEDDEGIHTMGLDF